MDHPCDRDAPKRNRANCPARNSKVRDVCYVGVIGYNSLVLESLVHSTPSSKSRDVWLYEEKWNTKAWRTGAGAVNGADCGASRINASPLGAFAGAGVEKSGRKGVKVEECNGQLTEIRYREFPLHITHNACDREPNNKAIHWNGLMGRTYTCLHSIEKQSECNGDPHPSRIVECAVVVVCLHNLLTSSIEEQVCQCVKMQNSVVD